VNELAHLRKELDQLHEDVHAISYSVVPTTDAWESLVNDGGSLNDFVGEFRFFHGTTADAANAIARWGFDERCCSTSGMFGAGVYFADNPTKSHDYADGHMFVARVSLGFPHWRSSSLNGARRPPCFEECSTMCAHQRYDSVIARKRGEVGGSWLGSREYIVYDRTQAYPEYLIEYST